MQHCRRAHARADIGRTGRQITEALVVSELELVLQRGVDLIEKFKSLFQLQTRAHRLHPQMIFFIDHDAERLPPIHDHCAAGAFGRMLAADQMTFDQHLFLQSGEVLQQF